MENAISIMNEDHVNLMNSLENILPNNMELFVFFGARTIYHMDNYVIVVISMS
jgi:hypothetical protein